MMGDDIKINQEQTGQHGLCSLLHTTAPSKDAILEITPAGTGKTVEQSQVKDLAAWYSLLKSRLYGVVQKSKHLTDEEMVCEVRKLTAYFPRVDQILEGDCPIKSEEKGGL